MRVFLRAGLVGLALLLAAPASGQDLQKGVEAYERGDVAAALREWRPLAEQGDATAQHILGVMYDFGLSVPQDYAEAMKWYRLAAEQGFAAAQYNIGLMYENGQGVLQDNVQAHMWFSLAAMQSDAEAAKHRDIVASKMTSTQIVEAQQLAKEWREKHPQ
jgi:TPR repeat protein